MALLYLSGSIREHKVMLFSASLQLEVLVEQVHETAWKVQLSYRHYILTRALSSGGWGKAAGGWKKHFSHSAPSHHLTWPSMSLIPLLVISSFQKDGTGFFLTWPSKLRTSPLIQFQVLKYCPKDLQADICVHLNRIILENNPAFRDANTGVKRAVARNFWISHVAPGDRIIHHGESLDVLYFIARGSLEVKQGETVVGLLGK